VFRRIENDMEALCDQRVLERLAGEERREYGMILLDMANDKYARVPGTSSISNGGKNISKRIEAIVRFKKYPKGMALVSVCIVIVLLSPELAALGNANGYQYNYRDYHPQKEAEFEKAMALARVNRCKTVAGAIDTYAKGLMYENGIYIASASSLSKHETLVNQMKSYDGSEDVIYRKKAGEKFEWVLKNGYSIFNIVETGEKEYEAYLLFDIVDSFDGTTNTLMVPIRITYEDAWVVDEFGEQVEKPYAMRDVFNAEWMFPGMRQYNASGESGEITVNLHMSFYINNEVKNNNSIFNTTTMDETINTNAEFEYAWLHWSNTYHVADVKDTQSVREFDVQLAAIKSVHEEADYTGADNGGLISYGLEEGGYISSGGGATYKISELEEAVPEAYKARILWDGEVIEELLLEQTLSGF
ncbi:MAG: hypothetical protein J6J03_06490, partial [Tyzzerella sp.]|nr:hypothetical protein [Tyzzerella sp.]